MFEQFCKVCHTRWKMLLCKRWQSNAQGYPAIQAAQRVAYIRTAAALRVSVQILLSSIEVLMLSNQATFLERLGSNGPKLRMSVYLKTPALLITPSKSCIPTPLLTPPPPLASSIMSFITSSDTSSFSCAAIRLRCAMVIGPSPPPVKSLYAASTSWDMLSSERECSFNAQTVTKEG